MHALRSQYLMKFAPSLGIAVVLLSAIGCTSKEETIKTTFPGTIVVYSSCQAKIKILGCSDMGGAEPRGNIISTIDDYPQAGWGFGRLRMLPEQTQIEWIREDTGQKFSQIVPLPKNLLGAKGTLLFYLDEKDEWSIWLTGDSNYLNDVPIHKSRKNNQ